jgi:type IV secretory pathway component VirB8
MQEVHSESGIASPSNFSSAEPIEQIVDVVIRPPSQRQLAHRAAGIVSIFMSLTGLLIVSLLKWS